jgi:CubicO group peptidase (beta-lactamase class C family)
VKELPTHLAEQVDARFAAFATDGDGPRAPGIAWGVSIGGRLVHTGSVGTLRDGEAAPPTPDSAFRIASMTKSFTSAAVLVLRDEGRLVLDDAVARHVPELAGLAGPVDDAPPITVRALLAMGSGLPTDDPLADRLEDLPEDAFSALLRAPKTAAWASGVAYEYSNLGYAILGRLIANVSGVGFQDFVAERLLRPLGLTSTAFSAADLPAEAVAAGHHRVDDSWQVQPELRPGAFSPIGGLYSSVRDIATWMAGFCDAWPPRDGPGIDHPLSRATRREMQQIATTIPPVLHRDHAGRLQVIAGGYCLGLVSEEDVVTGRAISHSGGYPGFGSHMRWHPATGIGVVALANGRYVPTWEPATDAIELLVAGGAGRRRRIAPAAALESARDDVERLLQGWDDGIAARFAHNVGLDDPLERRRAAVERLSETHGHLRRDGELDCETPLRGRWWLAGERGGRVEATVWLTAEVPPRIQWLEFESVPDPPPAATAAAAACVAAVNAGGGLPAELAFTDDGARHGAALVVGDAAAHLAPCELREVLRGDGASKATFLVDSAAGPFDLAITLDVADGRLARVELTPRARPTTLR